MFHECCSLHGLQINSICNLPCTCIKQFLIDGALVYYLLKIKAQLHIFHLVNEKEVACVIFFDLPIGAECKTSSLFLIEGMRYVTNPAVQTSQMQTIIILLVLKYILENKCMMLIKQQCTYLTSVISSYVPIFFAYLQLVCQYM